MSYKDLRDWLEAARRDGELQEVHGASWDLEMSSLAEIVAREGKRPVPTILFDDIPGYPKGYRTLFSMLNSPRRVARTLGIPMDDNPDLMTLLNRWRIKLRDLPLIPPKVVSSGPVQENVFTGEQIDVTKIPSIRHHELDGGRYIGTGHAIIQRDPDDGRVNLGTYRSMFIDRNRIALHMGESQDGRYIMQKYFERGQAMPVAVAIGMDPVLWAASITKVGASTSEYDYAGGIKGEPMEVIEGPYTGLPLPANAEIVIEGECHPGEEIDEGPFGEWHGYYSNLGLESVPEPVIRVKTIMHRNNPILTCTQPSVPPKDFSYAVDFIRAATIWEVLEAARVTGVKGVWNHDEGGSRLLNVVAIKQMYAGHSKRAGLVASTMTHTGRYTIVVDDDIDPSNLSEVMWAVATRSDPDRSIQILPDCQRRRHTL
ncbi:UbiD family decarboxylase [Chloroflexota bacterium]